MKKSIALLAPVALFLSGCDISDMVDGNILPTARAFFPAAQINHPRRDIIEINTHVSNVTEAFAQQVMAKLVSDHCCHGGLNFGDMDLVFPLAGYNMLSLTFDNALCIW